MHDMPWTSWKFWSFHKKQEHLFQYDSCKNEDGWEQKIKTNSCRKSIKPIINNNSSFLLAHKKTTKPPSNYPKKRFLLLAQILYKFMIHEIDEKEIKT